MVTPIQRGDPADMDTYEPGCFTSESAKTAEIENISG
jgi:hypothetical protein